MNAAAPIVQERRGRRPREDGGLSIFLAPPSLLRWGYSSLRARLGSTPAARLAGSQLARTATMTSAMDTAP